MSNTDSSGTGRCCANCGQSVEDLPYEYWAFHTCRACVLDAQPDRWGDGMIGVGTYRKWRYFPKWHMAEHPDLPEQKKARMEAMA